MQQRGRRREPSGRGGLDPAFVRASQDLGKAFVTTVCRPAVHDQPVLIPRGVFFAPADELDRMAAAEHLVGVRE